MALLGEGLMEGNVIPERTSIPKARQRLNARRPWAVILSGMALLYGGSATIASAGENIPFEELGGEQCFIFSRLVPSRVEGDRYIRPPFELIINNEEDYRKLFEPSIRRQSCDNVDPLKAIRSVDFSKKTVLGLFSSGSCADTGVERNVLKDESEKRVIFSVTVFGSDIACSGPGTESLNLIAVPKIPDEYRVVFEHLRSHQ